MAADRILERLTEERAQLLERNAKLDRELAGLRAEVNELRSALTAGGPTSAKDIKELTAAFGAIPKLREAVEQALEPSVQAQLQLAEIQARSERHQKLIDAGANLLGGILQAHPELLATIGGAVKNAAADPAVRELVVAELAG